MPKLVDQKMIAWPCFKSSLSSPYSGNGDDKTESRMLKVAEDGADERREVVVGLVRQGGVVDVDVVKFLGNVVERTIQSIDLRG